MKKLKTYKLVLSDNIDESTGLSLISLVESPAIDEAFVFFSKDDKEAKRLKFAIQEDRQIVTGPVLIPDMQIYRNIPEEHYVYIDKEGIEKAVKKFFKTSRINNVNAEHSSLLLNGIYPFESFIADTSRGMQAPEQFKDLPDGTWFLSYYVESPEIWSQVKNGTFKGFSIEGLFKQIEVQMSKVSHEENALALIDFFTNN